MNKLRELFDVKSDGVYESLSRMNDEGHSFKKIANFIEKNYENL
jgi:predicted CopG family antitoxin